MTLDQLASRLPWSVTVKRTLCPNLSVLSVPSDELPIKEGKTDLALLDALRTSGFSGIRAENDFWTIVWTMLYWNVIFQKLPDVFDDRLSRDYPAPGQDIPSDLFTPAFYPKRKEAFEARRAELAAKGLSQPLRLALQRHEAKPTRLLEFLPRLEPDELMLAASKVDTEAALKILDRLSWDYSTNRSGLPDLLIWAETPTLFEVKGPSDSVRQNQVDWLRFAAGGCGIPSAVFAIGWSDRKLGNLARRLSGPVGSLTLSYGRSSSKYFGEVEEQTASWPEVTREGEGKTLAVTASLPLSRIGEALPTLEKVARWKNARAEIEGRGTDLRSGGPLRCLAEKEKSFEGRDYCTRSPWGWGEHLRFGCRLFSHPLLSQEQYQDYGYRDSEESVFVLDKDKARQEIEAQVGELAVCPHFNPKLVSKELEEIPAVIDPSRDSDWAWVDSNHRPWFFEKGNWLSLWGDRSFPGVAQMVSVKRISREDRRSAKEYRRLTSSGDTFHLTIDVEEPTEGKRSGCAGSIAALLLLVTFVLQAVFA